MSYKYPKWSSPNYNSTYNLLTTSPGPPSRRWRMSTLQCRRPNPALSTLLGGSWDLVSTEGILKGTYKGVLRGSLREVWDLGIRQVKSSVISALNGVLIGVTVLSSLTKTPNPPSTSHTQYSLKDEMTLRSRGPIPLLYTMNLYMLYEPQSLLGVISSLCALTFSPCGGLAE